MSSQTLTALLLIAGLTPTACGGRSPSAPSQTVPNFAGEFAGTYVIDGCRENGSYFSGFCTGSGTRAGDTLPLEVTFTQSQTSVSGTVVLSRANGTPLTGQFGGVVQPSGHLTGTAALPSVPLTGAILYARQITSWDTTITGANLSGGFQLVYSSPTELGTMTVDASLRQMIRR